MNPRPPLRAGQGNRRRRPPAQAAARRHTRWLMNQLRRGLLVLRQLPARVRGRVDWRQSVTQAGQVVAQRGRALVPVAQRALAGVGKGLDRGTAELGKSAAASRRGLSSLSSLGARGLVRLRGVGARGLVRLRGVGARGFVRLAAASRIAGSATLRGARRIARDGARLAARLAAYIWEHRASLRALALRGAWWGALALLWYGGRTILDFRAPLAQDALPIFLIGLGLCLPLAFAAAARLRWAGFALGAGHAALAVVVWTIATSG